METINTRMTSPVLSIEQDKTVKNAAEIIYAKKIGSLLVTQNKKFVGIITKTDLMKRVLIKDLDAKSIITSPTLIDLACSYKRSRRQIYQGWGSYVLTSLYH